jgi:hypothetical protein
LDKERESSLLQLVEQLPQVVYLQFILLQVMELLQSFQVKKMSSIYVLLARAAADLTAVEALVVEVF